MKLVDRKGCLRNSKGTIGSNAESYVDEVPLQLS
jgi:hypothetical protein